MSRWIWVCLILLMSGYILFEHAADSHTIDLKIQIERHQKAMAGDSEFFNPWQYRVFSTLILEGCIRAYNLIVPAGPDWVPYYALRFTQSVIIFWLSILYLQRLNVRNPFLIGAGLLILCFCISHSTFSSDLSFNTYFDVIFYILAAILILDGHYGWLIPLTAIAALNRETSALIPLMLLAPSSARWRESISVRKLKIAAAGVILFAIVFVSVRAFYGYRIAVGIHGMNSPLDYFIFNITFLRLYPLLIGTLGIVPIVVVLNLSKLPVLLRNWFWLVVPVWFVIHLVMSTAVETRLFLVPQALIFIPAFLILADQWKEAQSRSSEGTSKLPD